MRAEQDRQAMLWQMQKMDTIGRMTSGVAHDFSSYLTIIGAATQMLTRPNLCASDRERQVAAISETVKRASRLTGQLLDFARVKPNAPETFAACDKLREIMDLLHTIGGPGITIVTDLPEDACLVQADTCRFDTAIINLVVNARDAMEGRGTLTLTIRRAQTPVAGKHGLRNPGLRKSGSRRLRSVAISIADTGPGIAADGLTRIFEPFFTTKEAGKGTGLGLSQVSGFVKQAGGAVTVDSVVGAGTTFTMYLPQAEAAKGLTRDPGKAVR